MSQFCNLSGIFRAQGDRANRPLGIFDGDNPGPRKVLIITTNRLLNIIQPQRPIFLNSKGPGHNTTEGRYPRLFIENNVGFVTNNNFAPPGGMSQ